MIKNASDCSQTALRHSRSKSLTLDSQTLDSHPGEIMLEAFLQPAGLTQTRFARQLGWTKAWLNELLRGERGGHCRVCIVLAEALVTSSKLWMSLQATYDLDRTAAKRVA